MNAPNIKWHRIHIDMDGSDYIYYDTPTDCSEVLLFIDGMLITDVFHNGLDSDDDMPHFEFNDDVPKDGLYWAYTFSTDKSQLFNIIRRTPHGE